MGRRAREPSPEQRRLVWNPAWDEYLVRLMVDQVNKGKRIENGFRKEAWHYMVIKFNRKFYQNLDKQQLKNRYVYFRKEYKLVKILIEQSEFSWDETRKIVKAEPEVWDHYILEHPEAKPYRTKSLPLWGELGIIFGNSIESSNRGEVLEEGTRVRGGLQSPVISSDDIASLEFEDEESSSSREDMSTLHQPNKRKFVLPTSSNCGKRARKDIGEIMLQTLQEMAANSRFRASQVAEASSEQELKKCIEELQSMEGLDDGLFVRACKMLKDEKNAVIFMTLKGDRRLLWVKEMCETL
ncbi:hypothetical protein AMTRI_Chr11g96540 [Amborella trichopoda]|uniref:Myb/SANT-like domain-containing protein n=1 Tax=Amborella trichopoda TaxID=13333 RepID=U5D2C5_AMBTC|nr:L10-interacting MYB domain-containing protein [Amborella trichopoda]XP_020529644.1 L10-interacting MYB domain-containing protein [Amborella trichopoda]ERN16559.1 hypothetical protein AMTR_s00031p00170040 [Amborella trichopoda]|eukprot:XP_006855092.1 L10-interacting MYB domain-containing protein [Amborella trichopoda]